MPDGLNGEGTNIEEKDQLYSVKGTIQTAESDNVLSNVTINVFKGGYGGEGYSGATVSVYFENQLY